MAAWAVIEPPPASATALTRTAVPSSFILTIAPL
jgi:hypothetical protein